ncbi:MAG TPA: maleylacetate reductase [Xanthobacteraceae bacterium]|nr:maleylacetate reductase [Xanthobacteraceae bacterium]
MPGSFVHDLPSQRVVFAPGALVRVAEEAERLGLARALVIATPGSGVRLGKRIVENLAGRAAGLHAQAVMHVPKPVADAGLAAAREAKADGLVAAGGGAAIGLAKIIARDLGLPILAVPTTYSGSEATAIWGLSDGERKFTGKDMRVLPRTIVYDPELTLALPAATSAASAMNAIAHCVEGLWVPDRTPFLAALATDATRRFGIYLPRVIAAGTDLEARGECLVAAWLAGTVLTAGTALQHKLAHVLGGLGLPHAETHAIILPHVTRFNLAAAADARARLADALGGDGADRLAAMLRGFPIPQKLSEVGFDRGKIDFVADEVAAMAIKMPRPASAEDVRGLLAAAY